MDAYGYTGQSSAGNGRADRAKQRNLRRGVVSSEDLDQEGDDPSSD